MQIIDDDTWLVIEQSDVEDSDADSEDSNAEGFYAHDYPGVWVGGWQGGADAGSGRQLSSLGPRLPTFQIPTRVRHLPTNSPALCGSMLPRPFLPADEASNLDSSDDGGYDPEGAAFHRGGFGGGGGRDRDREAGLPPRGWDEQSFGYGSD